MKLIWTWKIINKLLRKTNKGDRPGNRTETTRKQRNEQTKQQGSKQSEWINKKQSCKSTLYQTLWYSRGDDIEAIYRLGGRDRENLCARS